MEDDQGEETLNEGHMEEKTLLQRSLKMKLYLKKLCNFDLFSPDINAYRSQRPHFVRTQSAETFSRKV